MEIDDPSMAPVKKAMKNARTTAVKTDDHFSYNGWGKASTTIDYVWYSGFSSCTLFETVTKPYMDPTSSPTISRSRRIWFSSTLRCKALEKSIRWGTYPPDPLKPLRASIQQRRNAVRSFDTVRYWPPREAANIILST